MSKNHSIDYKNGITTIRFSQKPSFAEVQRVIDDIAQNYPYGRRLWDFGNIAFDFTMDEIRAIADYGKSKFIEPNMIAVVAPQDLAYGELRAFEVYREQKHAVARVFRSKKEALEWLEKQR